MSSSMVASSVESSKGLPQSAFKKVKNALGCTPDGSIDRTVGRLECRRIARRKVCPLLKSHHDVGCLVGLAVDKGSSVPNGDTR